MILPPPTYITHPIPGTPYRVGPALAIVVIGTTVIHPLRPNIECNNRTGLSPSVLHELWACEILLFELILMAPDLSIHVVNDDCLPFTHCMYVSNEIYIFLRRRRRHRRGSSGNREQ